jgi:hypothetical protein
VPEFGWISAAGADDRVALPDEAIGGDAPPALEALVHDVGIEGVLALKRLVAVRHQHDIIFRYDRISVCSLWRYPAICRSMILASPSFGAEGHLVPLVLRSRAGRLAVRI